MHMHGGLPPERVFCTRDRNKALEKLAHIVEELGFVKRKKESWRACGNRYLRMAGEAEEADMSFADRSALLGFDWETEVVVMDVASWL